MVRGVNHFGQAKQQHLPEKANETKQTPVSEELKTHTHELIRSQHKVLRKQIAKMLSDSQKGLKNEAMHIKKAHGMIEKNRSTLNQALFEFPEKEKTPFVEKQIARQHEMLESAQQTITSPDKKTHSLKSKASSSLEKSTKSLPKPIEKASNGRISRTALYASLQYANDLLGLATEQKLPSVVQFLKTIISQEQATLKSSPKADFTTFLEKYGYEGYQNGSKDSLMLCPQMQGHTDPGFGLPLRYVVDTTIFQSRSSSRSLSPAIQDMVQRLHNLSQLNTSLSKWVSQEILYNPGIKSSMSGNDISNYLLNNFNIFEQCPGVTNQQIEDVIKALQASAPSSPTLQLAMKLNALDYKSGTPLYNLQQALLGACTGSSSVNAFESWIQSHLMSANTDIYIQFPTITKADISSIMKVAGFSQSIPDPTEMDQLFANAYSAFQSDPKSPVYQDLYQEIAKLGSASENMQALQQWGHGILQSSDFAKSNAIAQANFCLWTGNITLGAMNTILNEWIQSGNTGQAALAKFILGKKFSSLEQMRSFFNPNSPSYGFGKFDIYFQVPSLLNSQDPKAIAQGFLKDLFAGSSTEPTLADPTQVDNAYAAANAALSGASKPDKVLYNLLINQCKTMGSNWDQLPYWAGWQSLTTSFTDASSAAQSLFLNSCGITNAKTAPLISANYYLKQMMVNAFTSPDTTEFLSKVVNELNSLISGNKTWADFQNWVKGSLFATDDIYMLCPGSNESKLSTIYEYLTGPDATLPKETSADQNYVALFQAMNAPGVYSGNKALYQDLLNAMLAVGSAPQDQAKEIQSYFTSNPSVLSQLKKDWANADTNGHTLFEKYTNNWDPSGS